MLKNLRSDLAALGLSLGTCQMVTKIIESSFWARQMVKSNGVLKDEQELSWMNLRVKMMMMMIAKKKRRLLEEISVTSDMKMTPPLWQKEPFDESERGE